MLLKMALGPRGLPHESVNVNDPSRSTREEFGWANAMVVVAVERLLPGVDCDAEVGGPVVYFSSASLREIHCEAQIFS